jgi:hypothetical protein
VMKIYRAMGLGDYLVLIGLGSLFIARPHEPDFRPPGRSSWECQNRSSTRVSLRR